MNKLADIIVKWAWINS